MLSIIIATHKRAAILYSCLEHLARQAIAKDLEVIVISDGPDKDTKDVCNKEWSIHVVYDEVPKSQQGVARNRGIELATKEYCLFINDDIFLLPNACNAHLTALQQLHTTQPTAVLGFTTWDPALQITKTMQFLEQSGWQFGYPKIAQFAQAYIPSAKQPWFTYSSNISLPTAVAKVHCFATDMQGYGWEDIEWGKRLQMSGVKLWYQPEAMGYHHHHLTLEDSLKRQYTIGKALPGIEQTYPYLAKQPSGLKKLASSIQALLPTLAGKHRKAYLQGIADAKRA